MFCKNKSLKKNLKKKNYQYLILCRTCYIPDKNKFGRNFSITPIRLKPPKYYNSILTTNFWRFEVDKFIIELKTTYVTNLGLKVEP